MSTSASITARFWLGMALPTFGLAVFTVRLAPIGGKGKEFAPNDRGLPAAALAPCLTLLERASKHPVASFTAWILSIAALILLARRMHRVRSR